MGRRDRRGLVGDFFRAASSGEAQSISSLNHPNIGQLYDIGCQDSIDYIVMEYVDSETLADRLAQGPMPLKQALRIAIEIADALDKAHARSLIHRDLKSSNLKLPDERGLRGKVSQPWRANTDFQSRRRTGALVSGRQRTLLHREDKRLMAVSIDTKEGKLQTGVPHALFQTRIIAPRIVLSICGLAGWKAVSD